MVIRLESLMTRKDEKKAAYIAKCKARGERGTRTYASDPTREFRTKRDLPYEVRPSRIADQIDGYDRDDLGESPDY